MENEKANIQQKVEPQPDEKGLKVKLIPASALHLNPAFAPDIPPSACSSSPRSSRTTGKEFIKISEVILRIGAGMLSLMAFSVMIAATETRTKVGNAVLITIKFSDFNAYNYLVTINALACIYSIVQLIVLRCGKNKSSFFSARFDGLLGTFICDQVMAYLLLSASSSGAVASELSRSGMGDIWASICSDWELNAFCVKPEAATGLSFCASFLLWHQM